MRNPDANAYFSQVAEKDKTMVVERRERVTLSSYSVEAEEEREAHGRHKSYLFMGLRRERNSLLHHIPSWPQSHKHTRKTANESFSRICRRLERSILTRANRMMTISVTEKQCYKVSRASDVPLPTLLSLSTTIHSLSLSLVPC